MNAPRKLVLVHGLFVNRHIMTALARYFRQRGWQLLVLNYPTTRQTLAQTAADWLPRIQAFADGEKLDFVGHSLGGLLLRHLCQQWPQGFHRAVTLGTPHICSAAGEYFHRFHQGKLLGLSWPEALDGNAPPWDARIPLLSLAGTKSSGLGTWFGLFRDEASDGTVAVAETRLPQASACCELPYSHTQMLFSRKVCEVVEAWLEGRTHPDIHPNPSLSFAE